MGEESNKPKKDGGDDLLSKLFDLDAPAPDQNPFGEPTKIDNTFVIQKPNASAGSEPKAELPALKPKLPITSGEVADDLFDGILDEEPEQLSVVSPADLTDIGITNAGQTVSPLIADDQAIEELTPELEIEPLEQDAPSTSIGKNPTQTARMTSPSTVKEADPIDEALAQFEVPSEKQNLKQGSLGKKSQAALMNDAFEVPDSSGDPQVSNRFSGSLSLRQSFVDVKKKKFAVMGAVLAFVILASGGFAWKKLSSDEGLLGYRLEGFQVVKAYSPPTASDLSEFEKTFEISRETRLSDDPQKIESTVGLLKSILTKDSRNLVAAGLIMEHSARLILWYGLKSNWPNQYESAFSLLTTIKNKKGITETTVEETRAKAARFLAVEDYSRVESELKALIGGSVDENVWNLLFEGLWKTNQKEKILELVAKLPSQQSPRTKMFVALAKDDLEVIRQLASTGYSPAIVEELSRYKLTKDNAPEFVRQIDEIRPKLQIYPLLNAKLDSVHGDALMVQGDSEKARQKWNDALSILPRSGAIWTKLALSFEDDAKWDDALAAYRSAEKTKSLTEDGLLRYAKLLRIRGKVVDALAQLDDVLKANPKNSVAHVEKGLVFISIYQEEQARGEFLKALEAKPNEESAILGLVQIALDRREWADAETQLKKIPETSPQYAESLLSLGRIALEQNRFREAEDSYLKAINRNSKLEAAYVELSRQYLLEEKDDKAMVLIDRSLAAIPKSPLLKVARARIYQFQGNLDKALAEVEAVQKSFDHLQDVNLAMADVFIDRKENTKAYEILSKYDANSAKDPEIMYLKVKAFIKEPENPRGLGSAEAASRLMEAVLRKKPDEVRFRLAAAQVAVLLQDKNTAIEHIDAIMKARPNFSPALIIRADFYRDGGDYDNAIPLYEEALKYTRFKGDIYKKLATGYKSLGKPALAIQYYQKVTASNPQDSQSHLELGKLYSDDGRYTAAMASLSRSIELNPNVPEAHYFLGFVLKELGNRKTAIKHFEKFLSMVPEGKEASTIRDEIYFLKNGTHMQ